MTASDALDRGRESFRRQAWGDVYVHLSSADHEAALEPSDLERLAEATSLLGRDDETADLLARAHHAHLRLGNTARAARCAFWLSLDFAC